MSETTSGTRPPSGNETVLFVAYIVIAMTVAALVSCLLTGLTAACIWRVCLYKKKRKRVLASSCRANQEYDDIKVIGPVYETVQPAGDLADDTQVPMTNNKAYKTIPVKRTNITSLDADEVNIKAHDTSGAGLILMEINTSYQIAVPKRSPITTSSEILPTSHH